MTRQRGHRPAVNSAAPDSDEPIESEGRRAAATRNGAAPLDLIAYRLGSTTVPIIPAPAKRDWMTATDKQFANRCLPMLIANQYGWLILNNAAFRAEWSGSNDISGLSVSYDSGSWELAGSHFGYGILTWSIPFLFKTPPGYNLLVRGPANCPRDAISPLEGIVESDWSSSTFTMNWKFTAPFTTVKFEVGEPICMIVPQYRADLENFQPRIRNLDADPGLKTQHMAWAESRKEFLGQRLPGWQKNYFQGKHVTGEPSNQPHQTRLHVSEFQSDVE